MHTYTLDHRYGTAKTDGEARLALRRMQGKGIEIPLFSLPGPIVSFPLLDLAFLRGPAAWS
jgi:hypothetical protein